MSLVKLGLLTAILVLLGACTADQSEPDLSEVDIDVQIQACPEAGWESAVSGLDCPLQMGLDDADVVIECGGVTVWTGKTEWSDVHAEFRGEGECTATATSPLLSEPLTHTFTAGSTVGFNMVTREHFTISPS